MVATLGATRRQVYVVMEVAWAPIKGTKMFWTICWICAVVYAYWPCSSKQAPAVSCCCNGNSCHSRSHCSSQFKRCRGHTRRSHDGCLAACPLRSGNVLSTAIGGEAQGASLMLAADHAGACQPCNKQGFTTCAAAEMADWGLLWLAARPHLHSLRDGHTPGQAGRFEQPAQPSQRKASRSTSSAAWAGFWPPAW